MKRQLILGICGSLRKRSSNEFLLQAASKLVGPGADFRIQRIQDLPFYNPDLDQENPPAEVKVFRAAVAEAHGLLVSSPEYAHGVPGVLKNALDWLVASQDFPAKPVVVVSGGSFAPVQLEETFRTMSARVVDVLELYGPTLRKAFDEEGGLIDGGLQEMLSSAVTLLLAAEGRRS